MKKLLDQIDQNPTILMYNESGNVVERKTVGAAGFDLPLHQDEKLYPFRPHRLKTGVYVALPTGYVGFVRERSSASNRKLMVLAGTIDEDYRGEILVTLMYYGDELDAEVLQGERFAQLVVVPYLARIQTVATHEELGETQRGRKGFGST